MAAKPRAQQVQTGAAVATGAANAEGTADTLARSDHGHEVTNLKIASEAQGDLLYRNATAWVRRAAGAAGAVLRSGGAGADPVWSAVLIDGSNNMEGVARLRVGLNPTTTSEIISGIGNSGRCVVSDNITDVTTKNARFGLYHETNSEEPFFGMYLQSTGSANAARFGGGTSSGNAATLIEFYTAATRTTPTGTLRGSITSAGLFNWVGDAAIGGDLKVTNHANFGAIVKNLTLGATGNLDWTLGNKQVLTLTANWTPTLTDPDGTAGLTLILKQNATGGFTVTWPSNFKWPDGIKIQPAEGASTVTVYTGVYDDDADEYYMSADPRPWS